MSASPVTVTEARRANYLTLFKRFQEKNYQIGHGIVKAFAAKVGVSDAYMSHIRCGRKEVGTKTARRMEEAFGLPEGWMDQAHDKEGPVESDEEFFVETFVSLLRGSPGEARGMMLKLIKEQQSKKSGKNDG